MRDLAWDDVKDMFNPLANGTLPDVRIEGTNLDDWQAVLDLPQVNGWRHEYEENGTAVPLPARAVDIIGRTCGVQLQRRGCDQARCRPGRMRAWCCGRWRSWLSGVSSG
jgi:hypothetical protein